jgi:[glutamine synthetase] adenylyltransferase / [glutamine synthetase]-adenylyl-L-tyrosine phosphorylase
MNGAIGPVGGLRAGLSRWAAMTVAMPVLAPYLGRLAQRFPEILVGPEAAHAAQAGALAQAAAIALEPCAFEEGMARLRRAKAQTHLAAALLDLSCEAELAATTGAIAAFADGAARAALALSARALAERGFIDNPDYAAAEGPIPGFLVIAMGKGGAFELNYSSDIDLSLFFEPDRLPVTRGQEPRPLAQRIVQHLVRALEAITADGYVFRTDLRLRPDPNSTNPAVSVAAAAHYYQSRGQNWERAAFIKARACAGDIPAGEAFLRSLEGFVWRRHLDYAAIEDLHAIKRRIRAAKGKGDLSDPAFDVKLGWGGIRDIELFTQTQQLILGGRRPELRAPATLAALDRLAEAGAVAPDEAGVLAEAYVFFRHVEHRLQMVGDEQTHTLPADPAAAGRIAALCGMADLGVLDQAIAQRRGAVTQIDAALFSNTKEADDPLADLTFTGVENDPATDAQLRALGFKAPGQVGAVVREWRSGRLRALRTERARRLLTGLTPRLLRAAAQGDDPDLAFARFADLVARLSAGVQVLSLFEAQPALLNETMAALELSQPLAEAVARRPALLDGLAEPRFYSPLAQDPPGALSMALQAAVAAAPRYEEAMNAARRAHREEALRIGMQVLKGVATAADAGAAYAKLAEASVQAMAHVAAAATAAARGPLPGRFAVLALGKLGGRELSAGSDLDLMVVYQEADAAAAADAGQAFAKLTQRLITGLNAPTEEGLLYEVDMQLRPSGSKGPVAVRLSSFSRYYREEAWTWELMALTRARPVAGDDALCASMVSETRTICALARDDAKVRRDAAAMRALMERERPAAGPWDLKLKPGGVVDIEFIAQALQLTSAAHGVALCANTGEALAALADAGALKAEESDALTIAWRDYANLTQVLRLCASSRFAPGEAGRRLKELLERSIGVAGFSGVEARLRTHALAVRRIFLHRLGDGSQDGPALNLPT